MSEQRAVSQADGYAEPHIGTDAQSRVINLSNGMRALVSLEDYERLSQCKWAPHSSGPNKPIYAHKHMTVGPKRYTKVTMHREILRDVLAPGMHVDHINGDGLDNRRSNLRICTPAENARNRGASRRNLVGLKGVRKNGNGFGAQVMADRKWHWLGTFATPTEAHAAYCLAASSLHGEFYKSGCPILPESND